MMKKSTVLLLILTLLLSCSTAVCASPVSSQETADYTVAAESAGRYLLSVSAKAEEESFINISSGGEALGNTPIRRSEAYIENMIYVNLSAGSHELKLFTAGPAVDIAAVTVQKVTDDKTVDSGFLSALNGAKSKHDVLSAFETYGEALGIHLDSILAGVDYPKAVYMNMADRSFRDIDEALSALLNLAESEKSDPSVSLRRDGERVSEASTGNLSIVIKNSRIGDRPVFGALYTGGSSKKLLAMSKAVLSEEGYTVDFGQVTVKAGDEVSWNVFFFNDLESLQPYEPYGGVYRDLYVAADGSDTGDGSEDKPFATISRAKEAAKALSDNMYGDIVIHIGSGEYFISETETFGAAHSGQNGFNIVYRGSDEGETVISGGERVTGWQEGENGIWSAHVEADVTDVRNLYIDGVAAERSRSAWRYTYLEDYDDEAASYEREGFVTSTTGGFPQLTKPQYAETVWELMWECKRVPIQEIRTEGDKTVVLWNGAVFYDPTTLTSTRIGAGKEYYIENDLSLVDTPGEFYYDRDTKVIYYYPYPEENLQTAETVIGVTEGLMKIEGDKNTKVKSLVFENVSFRYGAWNHASTYGLIGGQSDSFYNPVTQETEMLMLPQVELNFAENIKILNCEFSSLGSAAVAMKDGVKNALFEGNIIKDVSGTGLIIGRFKHADKWMDDETMEICQNIRVRNNVLRRVGTEYRQNVGISVYYENAVSLEHNDICGTPYTGISVGWGWEDLEQTSPLCRNLSVTNNKVVDVLGTLSDGANIYSLGSNYEAKIAGNYFADNNVGSYPGIYLDAGSSYMNVHDNLVLGNGGSYLFIQRRNDDTANYQARYNKVYNNHSDTVRFSQSGTVTSDTNALEEAQAAYSEGQLTAAAQSILDSAGLEEGYSGLIQKAEAPGYIRNYIKTTPQHEYVDGLRFEVEDYTEKSAGGIVEYDEELGINAGSYLTYTINAEAPGFYRLSLAGKHVSGDTPHKISLELNGGKRKYSAEFAHSASYESGMEEVFLSYIYLEKGENTLKLTLVSGAMHADYMRLSQAQQRLEIEDYTEKSDGGIVDYETIFGVNTGSYLTYKVNTEAEGYYSLTLAAECVGDTEKGEIMLDVNGGKRRYAAELVNSAAHESGSCEEVLLSDIYLEKGENTLKLEFTSATMHADYMLISPAEQEHNRITVEAEDYTQIYGGHKESVGISYNTGNWQEYSVYSYGEKTYMLSVCGASPDGVWFNISVGGEAAGTDILFNATGSLSSYATQDICTVTLQEGWNTIKIANAGGGMYFDKFFLTEAVQ